MTSSAINKSTENRKLCDLLIAAIQIWVLEDNNLFQRFLQRGGEVEHLPAFF